METNLSPKDVGSGTIRGELAELHDERARSNQRMKRRNQKLDSPRNGGLAAALTACSLAVVVLVCADFVAYVPSANTLGFPPLSFGFPSFLDCLAGTFQ